MPERRNLQKIAIVAAVGGVVAVSAALLIARELRVQVQAAHAVDTAAELARLHGEAASGSLAMLRPAGLPMALIEAGFPPKRPVPDLLPRAALEGGKAVVIAEKTVSVAHYAGGGQRVTVFLLPPFPEAIPADAAPVVRQGQSMRLARRDGVTVAYWTSGAWIAAVAVDATGAERDALLELVRRAQGT